MEHTLRLYAEPTVTRSRVVTKVGPVTVRKDEGFDYLLFVMILLFWIGPLLERWLH